MKDAPVRIWARPDYNECWLKKGEEEDELYHHDDKVQALVRYAEHKPSCGMNSGHIAARYCTCGFDAAIEQFNPTRKEAHNGT